MKLRYLSVGILLLSLSCTQRQEPLSAPWEGEADSIESDAFDLFQIEQAGEMIGLTLSGPDTYYDFRGRHLGLHYLLCQEFAQHLGVKLRMEVCRDTAELLQRLSAGDADMAVIAIEADSASPGWKIGEGKPELREALRSWYRPTMMAEMRETEKRLLTQPRVSRRVYAPMLSKGVISRYDKLFKYHSRSIGWDWRLMAAQCYQESTFDPKAKSWAGACGLMQIMPQTANHLGLAQTDIFKPEQNIAAAARYLKELDRELSIVRNRQERQNLVLAAYNGGLHHIRDAMRLAERDGRNPHLWSDVRSYILRLSDPRFYSDSLVRSGYMRGQETAEYVDNIKKRYEQYRRSVR